MDNDVRNTEYCIGFSTAITRAADAIQRQRTTVASHERIGIFRVFGRDAGFTALYTAYVTSIRCVIPEYKVNLDKLIRLLMEEKQANPSNYALIVLSEGAEWEGYEVQQYGEPTPTATARRRAWPSCSRTRSSGAPARRPSCPTSPTTCARATPTSSTS